MFVLTEEVWVRTTRSDMFTLTSVPLLSVYWFPDEMFVFALDEDDNAIGSGDTEIFARGVDE